VFPNAGVPSAGMMYNLLNLEGPLPHGGSSLPAAASLLLVVIFQQRIAQRKLNKETWIAVKATSSAFLPYGMLPFAVTTRPQTRNNKHSAAKVTTHASHELVVVSTLTGFGA